MPWTMFSLTRVRWLTSARLSPAWRRAAASVAPMLTPASKRTERPLQSKGLPREHALLADSKPIQPAGRRLRRAAPLARAWSASWPANETSPARSAPAGAPPGGGEEGGGERAGVAAPADRDGRDRDPGRHLDNREQRVQAAHVRQRNGD